MKLFKNKDIPHGDVEVKSIDTVIGPGVVFEGILQAEKGVCIEGTFKGHLLSKGVVLINQAGSVQADVNAAYVVVHGGLTGNIIARQQLDVGPTGKIQGDVEARTVTVAKGGILDGRCKMRTHEPPLDQPEPTFSLEGPHPILSEIPAEPADPISAAEKPADHDGGLFDDDDTLDDIIVPIDTDDPLKPHDDGGKRIHVISESKKKS